MHSSRESVYDAVSNESPTLKSSKYMRRGLCLHFVRVSRPKDLIEEIVRLVLRPQELRKRTGSFRVESGERHVHMARYFPTRYEATVVQGRRYIQCICNILAAYDEIFRIVSRLANNIVRWAYPELP